MRKNLQAATTIFGFELRHASAITFTVLASFHTFRLYNSIMTLSALFEAVSFASYSIWKMKVCSFLLMFCTL